MWKLPSGLPHNLVHVIDSDSDVDNRTCAMICLNNIALHSCPTVLAGNEVVACALRVVREQGTGAAPPHATRWWPLPSSVANFLSLFEPLISSESCTPHISPKMQL